MEKMKNYYFNFTGQAIIKAKSSDDVVIQFKDLLKSLAFLGYEVENIICTDEYSEEDHKLLKGIMFKSK